ncbi:MAG: nitroreductase family protein [Pseudomonadota bacterium]|nr:nitroreductase family protein [Pseudomonadota bacterium]
MELYEVMRTTFAAREFTEQPVSDETIAKILEEARFAPSGGNRQGWHVLVVREDASRTVLRDLIAPQMQRYVAQVKAGEAPLNTINPSRVSAEQIAQTKVPQTMLDNLTGAPVILLVFVDLSVVASFDSHLNRVGVISGASIYPFVWNILLAARNEGLGGTLTTFAAGAENDVKAHFGVPGEMALAAMIPMGQPLKQLTKLTRKPVADFVRKEHWNGEALID